MTGDAEKTATRAFPTDLLVAVLLYLVAVFLTQPWGNHPLNDDWYYARPALSLAQSGWIQILSGQAAWSYPQILLGALVIKVFGFSHVALRLFGVTATVLTAAVFRWFLCQATTNRWLSFFGLILFLFFPPVFINSISFMSDIPFLLLWMLSCAFWSRALRNPTNGNFALATAVSLIGMSQRQFGLLVPVFALFLWWFINRRRSVRATYLFAFSIAVMILGYVGCGLIWTHFLNAPVILDVPHFSLKRSLNLLFMSGSYVALISAPLLLLLPSPKLSQFKRKRWWGFAAVLFFYTIVMFSRNRSMPYFENEISRYGAFRLGEIISGPRPQLLARWFMIPLSLFTTTAIILFVSHTIDWLKQKDYRKLCSPLGFLVFAGAGYLLALTVLRDQVVDRYLFASYVAGIALPILIFSEKPQLESKRLSLAVAGLFTALFVSGSILITQDYLQWTNVRWEAAEWLMQQGVEANDIDAGHEWNWWRLPNDFTKSYPKRLSDVHHASVEFDDPHNEVGILRKFPFHGWLSEGEIIARKTD